jgi:hypothetical protein
MTDQELADSAGIPLRILLAIRRVESAGSVRAVRFEPHKFHRDTGGRFTTAQVPYTPSGRPTREAVSFVESETNRAAFERAFRLEPRVAVTSSSWGAYQVLGGHLLSVAGPDPARAVAAFDANPLSVSEAMFLSWFRGNDAAQRAARAGDIDALARLYNGRGWEPWAAAVRRALASLPSGAGAAAGGAGLGLVALAAALGYAWWRSRR